MAQDENGKLEEVNRINQSDVVEASTNGQSDIVERNTLDQSDVLEASTNDQSDVVERSSVDLDVSVDDPADQSDIIKESLFDQSEGGGLSKCISNKYVSLKKYSSRYKITYPRPYVCNENEMKHEIDSEFVYNMNTYPRGKLVIINEKYFHPVTKLQNAPRFGTEKDVENLTKLFLDLGFIVQQFDSLSKDEVYRELSIISRESFENLSCFACAILSHGKEDVFYATDGQVNIKTITNLFTKSNLSGKPKIFFIQACQGDDYMIGNNEIDDVILDDVAMDITDGAPNSEELKFKIPLPTTYDFLYGYSAVKGYQAWRNDKKGTWFIETLCQLIRQYCDKYDLVKILSKVNYQLSSRRSNTLREETNNKRQISSAVIDFTKEFYFFPPFPIKI